MRRAKHEAGTGEHAQSPPLITITTITSPHACLAAGAATSRQIRWQDSSSSATSTMAEHRSAIVSVADLPSHLSSFCHHRCRGSRAPAVVAQRPPEAQNRHHCHRFDVARRGRQVLRGSRNRDTYGGTNRSRVRQIRWQESLPAPARSRSCHRICRDLAIVSVAVLDPRGVIAVILPNPRMVRAAAVAVIRGRTDRPEPVQIM